MDFRNKLQPFAVYVSGKGDKASYSCVKCSSIYRFRDNTEQPYCCPSCFTPRNALSFEYWNEQYKKNGLGVTVHEKLERPRRWGQA